MNIQKYSLCSKVSKISAKFAYKGGDKSLYSFYDIQF